MTIYYYFDIETDYFTMHRSNDLKIRNLGLIDYINDTGDHEI